MEDFSGEGRSLSELPEHILSHILSFLPTKDAVRTSILSKRWEYIWTSIPKLSFWDGHGQPMDFINIVDRSLRLRGSFDIISFSVDCDLVEFFFNSEDMDIDLMSHIGAWLSDVVRFNVQDIKLSLLGDDTLTLPFGFVNCRTLTDMTISAPGIALEFSSPVCFSNLKTLDLCGVIFPDEHSTQKLFSGCPMLEDLKLELCSWEYVKAVSVVSPRLQLFTMIEDEELFEKNFSGYEFVIFGGGLKYFYYEGQFQFDFNILNSQLLDEVHIKFSSIEDGPIPVFNHFLKLLKYASNVPNLILMNAQCLLDMPELLIHIPMFSRVRCLELDYESSDFSNIGLLMMLENMPCLESLMLTEGIKDYLLYPVPSCFFNRLGVIIIFIKKGDVNDLIGVYTLLKYAVVLKEMNIEFSEFVNEDTRKICCSVLLSFPRGSRDCAIHIWEKR